MALVNCPECNKEISEQAESCPNCGFAIKRKQDKIGTSKKMKLITVIMIALIILGGSGWFIGNKIHNNKVIETAMETAIEAAIIKDQKAFDAAKEAYTELCNAADLTISVMNSVYGAWFFGIYKSKDSSTSSVLSDLSKSTALSESDLEVGLTALAESFEADESIFLRILANKHNSEDIKTWEYCLLVVNTSYNMNGIFDKIQESIDVANASLQTMTAEFDDYKHYPALKEFYSKVTSYFDFAKSPTGSFQQLKDTINDYENNIRTYRSDLSFVFK